MRIDLSDPRVSISELFGEGTGSDDEEQSVAEMHRAALKEKLMLADIRQLVEIANRAGVTCAEQSLEMVRGLSIEDSLSPSVRPSISRWLLLLRSALAVTYISGHSRRRKCR